ncbi:hypothetical protein GCM10011345_37680 [Gemmobacter megaterium]|nr:hypothetical protein GCM10011345_37680 [Gemmobacter megaterium]
MQHTQLDGVLRRCRTGRQRKRASQPETFQIAHSIPPCRGRHAETGASPAMQATLYPGGNFVAPRAVGADFHIGPPPHIRYGQMVPPQVH